MRLFAAVGWLIASVGIAHAATAPLYDSPEGGFAFTPPLGWETKKDDTEKFPVLTGPKDDARAPYVVIQEIADKREFFTFGDAAVKDKLKDPRFQLSKRDAFQTADKAFGVKFAFSYTPTGLISETNLPYKQVYYLVPGPPGTIYAIIATIPEAGWDKYQPALDDMMKSFHLRPVVAAAKAVATAATSATVQGKASGTVK